VINSLKILYVRSKADILNLCFGPWVLLFCLIE